MGEQDISLAKAKALIAAKDFSTARRVLAALLDAEPAGSSDLREIRQKLALCTYKDSELQADIALEQAWEILARDGDLEQESDSETLCLAGAIRKRLGETAANPRDFEAAVWFYRRARDVTQDLEARIYAAVNYAYTLRLLARLLEGSKLPGAGTAVKESEEESRKALEEVVAEEAAIRKLHSDNRQKAWWPRASLAEAYFGLGRYDDAEALLIDAGAETREQAETAGKVEAASDDAAIEDWKQESTFTQLAGLAHMVRDPEEQQKARTMLGRFLHDDAVRALVAGRLGLALSGGGFRAALFHVGTLARLAELDLLRHVQVLSCVSGGSIVGALYYLELQKELQRWGDAHVGQARYIDVVERVRDRLCKALNTNIRTRTLLRAPTLGRTKKMGELLDEALYAPAAKPQLTMEDLKVSFKNNKDFNPKRHNWRRGAKVPILIINATTLNTGHNWQFTATWMGEPPMSIEPAIDATERLRRLYYPQAPTKDLQSLRLHTAVAASAAVPAVFTPIALKALFADRNVCLADGGVHDNQGVFGLIEQDCAMMIVSDGCGQLGALKDGPRLAFPVATRANNVMMDVIRRNTYRILTERQRGGRLRGLRMVHLKQGLATRDVTWVGGTPTPADAVQGAGPSPLGEAYQRALAEIRTDLDAFSVIERDALMAAGNMLADQQIDPAWAAALTGDRPATAREWKFTPMIRLLKMPTPGADNALLRELQCGRHRTFRALRQSLVGELAGQGSRIVKGWWQSAKAIVLP